MNHHEVTKEVFYATIGPQDVVVAVGGNYPYTVIFETRYGKEVGRIDDQGRCLLRDYVSDPPYTVSPG